MTLIAAELLIAIAVWLVVTYMYRHVILAVFPTTRVLVVLLLWIALGSEATGVLAAYSIVPPIVADFASMLSLAMFALAGVALVVALKSTRHPPKPPRHRS